MTTLDPHAKQVGELPQILQGLLTNHPAAHWTLTSNPTARLTFNPYPDDVPTLAVTLMEIPNCYTLRVIYGDPDGSRSVRDSLSGLGRAVSISAHF